MVRWANPSSGMSTSRDLQSLPTVAWSPRDLLFDGKRGARRVNETVKIRVSVKHLDGATIWVGCTWRSVALVNAHAPRRDYIFFAASRAIDPAAAIATTTLTFTSKPPLPHASGSYAFSISGLEMYCSK